MHKVLGSNSPVAESSPHEHLAMEREGGLLKRNSVVGGGFDEKTGVRESKVTHCGGGGDDHENTQSFLTVCKGLVQLGLELGHILAAE